MAEERPEPEAGQYGGVWEGQGRQDDGQTWPMRLEVRGAQADPCATVQYPAHDDWEVSCTGQWECDPARSTPSLLVGTEQILDNEGRCIDGCSFQADLRTGIVEFDCSHRNVMGQAVLHRPR